MAVTCGFFNSLGGDRKYPADDVSRIFDGVIQDGVYMSIGDKFAVTATTGMTVNVGSGRAWFNHTWTLNDTDLPILMDDPDLVLDRIDAIVLEIDHSEEVRNNTIKAVKGTASSDPQNPVMVNTEFIEQIPFAYITRKHGVTEIKTEDIKIVVGTSECPYVTSILEAANIDELFVQWEAQFGSWQESQKDEFTAWFEGIRGQLDEDPAGHLQNQIDKKGIQVYTHSRSGSVNELTGAGPNGRALITSDIQEGDTWTVNGSPVTAYVGTNDATSMMAGLPYTGKWITFVFDGESINFKGGGGLSAADKAKLIPSNIREGVKFFEGTPNEVVGTLTWKDLLPDDLVLFSANDLNPLLGGWAWVSNRQPTIAIDSTIRISFGEGLPNTCNTRSTNKIDVTDYKTLKITVTGAGGNQNYFTIGGKSCPSFTGAQSIAIDVSSLSGEHYIELYMYDYYQRGSTVTISKIELSKL